MFFCVLDRYVVFFSVTGLSLSLFNCDFSCHNDTISRKRSIKYLSNSYRYFNELSVLIKPVTYGSFQNTGSAL